MEMPKQASHTGVSHRDGEERVERYYNYILLGTKPG